MYLFRCYEVLITIWKKKLLSCFTFLCKSLLVNFLSLIIFYLGAAGGPVRISCSGDSSKQQTIAEEAVDQLQENEKLVAGM